MKELPDENLWQCEECSMKYKERELAKRCEEFCRENRSCNADIIKHAVR